MLFLALKNAFSVRQRQQDNCKPDGEMFIQDIFGLRLHRGKIADCQKDIQFHVLLAGYSGPSACGVPGKESVLLESGTD